MDKRIAHILHRGTAADFRDMAEMARTIPGGSAGIAEALDSVAFALEPDSPNKQWMNADAIPFTVIVEDMDKNNYGETQNHICLVMALNPHEAGAKAVDRVIYDMGVIREESDEDPDTIRMDLKCIAIYEGHLTNLVQ